MTLLSLLNSMHAAYLDGYDDLLRPQQHQPAPALASGGGGGDGGSSSNGSSLLAKLGAPPEQLSPSAPVIVPPPGNTAPAVAAAAAAATTHSPGAAAVAATGMQTQVPTPPPPILLLPPLPPQSQPQQQQVVVGQPASSTTADANTCSQLQHFMGHKAQKQSSSMGQPVPLPTSGLTLGMVLEPASGINTRDSVDVNTAAAAAAAAAATLPQPAAQLDDHPSVAGAAGGVGSSDGQHSLTATPGVATPPTGRWDVGLRSQGFASMLSQAVLEAQRAAAATRRRMMGSEAGGIDDLAPQHI
jgi:hypothetical protein